MSTAPPTGSVQSPPITADPRRPLPFSGPLDRALGIVENLVAGASLVAAVTIALSAIILREIFGVFLFWSEEVIIYLVITSTFFGAILTLRNNEHVNVDIVNVFLGHRGKRIMAVVAGLVTTAYLAAVAWLAWMMMNEPFSRDTLTPALKLPLWVVELPVALALTIMFLRALQLLVYAWRHGPDEVSAHDVALAEAEATGLTSDHITTTRAHLDSDSDGGVQ